MSQKLSRKACVDIGLRRRRVDGADPVIDGAYRRLAVPKPPVPAADAPKGPQAADEGVTDSTDLHPICFDPQ